jgi:hypothetical protein
MPAEKPFPFRKPGESEEQAADRISKELEEASERDDAVPGVDKKASGGGDSEAER